MAQHRPRIVVVGAGIIGSAITYYLARRGADALLVDQGPKAGSGVTGRAFGWINVINGTPGEQSYALWCEAIAEYRALRAVLPSAFSGARPGSLLWKNTPEETETFCTLHRQAGERVELLSQKTLQDLEPHIRMPPDLAVLSPDDLALDPGRLAQDLVAAAVAAGASTLFGTAAHAIETLNGKVSGLNLGRQTIPADIVIMAAGYGTRALTDGLGIQTGLTTSPALLLRYACRRPVIRHILRGPRLEIRQARDGSLLVAKSYVPNGDEDGPQLIGRTLLDVMREELDLRDDVTLKSAEIGERPVFGDGLPRMGFLPDVDNLYLAVGHPGLILGPLIGRMTADAILGGEGKTRL